MGGGESVPVPGRTEATVGPSLSLGGMYTVAKGPTALLQKTRRGLARGLESAQGGQEAIIFHPVKMRNNQRRRVQHEHLTEDHQELITFVTEGWVRVKREMEQGDGAVAVYQDTTNPTLDHFQPFDLDAWWGRKLYQDLTSGL